MLLEKTDLTLKILELPNGCIEVIKPDEKPISATEFYKFLAKLLIEDKKLQKNESPTI